MRKPTIGITSGVHIDTAYAEAVAEFEGTPAYLSPDTTAGMDIRTILNSIDGLLLAGGKDVHPSYYESRNQPGDEEMSTSEIIAAYRMNCEPERDAFEIPLIRAVYDARIPIFGICRGLQVLNVALGGSMVKDIRTGRKHWAVRADEPEDGSRDESRKHLITIVPMSKLSEILGDCPRLVNSRHHQGITDKEISAQLRASAYAPDGIVEAVESLDNPWAIAVQWHPEKREDDYVWESSQALFESFIAAAKAGA